MAPQMILAAASTAMKAAGALQSGMAESQADTANAHIADANAAAASQQANLREEQIRREGRSQLGEQAADIAEAGIGFTGGALDAMRQSATKLSMDALNTRYEGTVQRTNFENESQIQRAKAKNARIAGWIGAGTAILQGASDYAKGGGGGGLGGGGGGDGGFSGGSGSDTLAGDGGGGDAMAAAG